MDLLYYLYRSPSCSLTMVMSNFSKIEISSVLIDMVDQTVVYYVSIYEQMVRICYPSLEHFRYKIIGQPNSVIFYSQINFVRLAITKPKIFHIFPILWLVAWQFFHFDPVIFSFKFFHILNIFFRIFSYPKMPLIKRIFLFQKMFKYNLQISFLSVWSNNYQILDFVIFS